VEIGMSVQELNLEQARQKMAAKQDELGKVFEQALVTGGDGRKQYDFNKVTVLGADVKGSIAVAEKVNQMNAELNELGEHVQRLDAAEKAAAEHAARNAPQRGFRPPGGKGDGRGERKDMKSLGDMLAESKAYQDYAKAGAPGGISLLLQELLPSDMLAMGAAFSTMGSKTLMATSAGFAPESFRLPNYVEAATRPIQLLDIIPMFPTDQAAIKYMEETTRTHAAAELAEGAAYAESAFVFTERQGSIAKIGDSLPVTDEQLEDVAMMNGYINSRLTFGVRQPGSPGADRQRHHAQSARHCQRCGHSDPGQGRRSGSRCLLQGDDQHSRHRPAMPTHHVMHPTDWQNVRLLRTADGVYIWGSPAEAGVERLWGLPVVQQDAGAAGTGYVGSFQPSWISLFERRGVDVQVGYVGTQFTEGSAPCAPTCA
jgi:hypothetical protein